ncbi:MAG: ABC transporter ATP-binding protein [Anaerolineales bacterium]|nr:ABC transporter ATP-binding protein [Anaerolineales bacterium]MDW8161220.1 ABC transporter ATP-binding protein [Anaerolineales bacterium]
MEECAPESADQEFILRMENIYKSFPGGVQANRGITLEVRSGEIHCLLGENGAGKTVLMSILYGLYKPDSGCIYYKGKKLDIHNPKDAIRHRIGMVHQHFMLVPTLTVAENIVLGQYPPWKVLNHMEEVHERIRAMSDEFGLDVDPTKLVQDLSVGEQQRVEILKALYHGADLLILDEPTAVLTPQESEHLLKFLRQLADRGLTIIFITHKLEEVMEVSDRVTVLRDGRVVGTVNTSETNPRELARMMVGREVLMELKKSQTQPGKVIFAVRDLRVRDARGLEAVKGVSFEVREREILGIAGVSGNGQTELALALAGLIDCEFDEMRLDGQILTKHDLHRLHRMGMAHVPEDRQRMGLILPFSVAENFVLKSYRDEPFSKRGFLRFEAIREYSRSQISKFNIRVGDIEEEIAHLSGGNQQKVVVARELDRHPRFLLVNQPTRGIDIGATEFVRQQILAQRDAGAAILLISADLEEIFALSDRILVMFEGRFMGEVPPDPALIEQVGLMMAGKAAVPAD